MTNAASIPHLPFLCVLFFFVAVSSAWGVDPSRPVSSYIRNHFTNQDGLPSNIVHEIAQSRDGFLWLNAGGKLIRFDGRHFTQFEQVRDVVALALAPDGDLWLGTTDTLQRIPAAALNQYGPLPATSYHPGPGPSEGSKIVCLHFTRNGILWVGTQGGLYRFEHDAFWLAIGGTIIERIEEASNGHLLVSTSRGLMEWDGSQVVLHPELAAQVGVEADKMYHVFQDSHGVTWFCTENGVARSIGGTVEKLAPWGRNGHAVYRASEDPSGTLWFAGAEGLFRFTASGLELSVGSVDVRYIYGDRDGNLWVGTNGDGLYRFKDRAVRMFTKTDGLPNNNAMTVLTTHDGAVWSGFNCGGIARFDGHGFRIYNEKDGLLNSCAYTLAEDANHDLWIGTYGGGVFRLHDRRFTQYSKSQGLASNTIISIVAARDGSLWLLTPAGVSRMRNGKIRNYTVADGLSDRVPFSVYEDRTGGIWLGTRHGADRLAGDRFVHFSSLPQRGAEPIGEDRSGSLYFIVAPGMSIYRLENNQVMELASSFDADQILETEQGDLWLSGERIVRVPPRALDHPHLQDDPLDFAAFGPADGLAVATASFGRPNLALTPEGKLWIATTQGLAMLDLPHLPRTDRNPTIYMEELTVGR